MVLSRCRLPLYTTDASTKGAPTTVSRQGAVTGSLSEGKYIERLEALRRRNRGGRQWARKVRRACGAAAVGGGGGGRTQLRLMNR